MIDVLFPTLVYSENIGTTLDNNILYKKALDIRNISPKSSKDFNVYNTLDIADIRSDPDISKLVTICKDHVKNFADKMGAQYSNIFVRDCWLNVYDENDFQEIHTHIYSHISLVYYVKVPENSGDLFILAPDYLTNTAPIRCSVNSVKYMPTESDIIIFKSNVPHRVSPNKSKEHRVSIAMNFILD